MRALAPARVENNRASRSGLAGRRAAAMGVPFKSELATAKPCPEENPGGRGDNQERDGLLPVHARNIVQGGRFATKIITTCRLIPAPIKQPCLAQSISGSVHRHPRVSTTPNAPLPHFTAPAALAFLEEPLGEFSGHWAFHCFLRPPTPSTLAATVSNLYVQLIFFRFFASRFKTRSGCE